MAFDADNLDAAKVDFAAGKAAFERGEYRKSVDRLEQARSLVSPNSVLGGDVQTWLVMAYEAAGQRHEALTLCRALTKHPDLNTRKEGKRILYILEAPKLQSRPEWLTQIPDLGNLPARHDSDRVGAAPPRRTAVAEPPRFKVETDLSQVNTEDNRFVWVALIATIAIVAGLLWLA